MLRPRRVYSVVFRVYSVIFSHQLSEDERIHLECEAREDYWKRQSGINKLLTQKDQTIAEKEQAIAEKEQAIGNKDKEIAKLKAMLAESGHKLT